RGHGRGRQNANDRGFPAPSSGCQGGARVTLRRRLLRSPGGNLRGARIFSQATKNACRKRFASYVSEKPDVSTTKRETLSDAHAERSYVDRDDGYTPRRRTQLVWFCDCSWAPA